MTNQNKKPFQSIRDGALKATIWRNESEEGKRFYSVEFSRTYTDQEGNYHDSSSFSGAELLRVGFLAQKAYDVISEARSVDRKHAA